MNGMRKGMLLGVIQVAMVLSLGGKLLYDRITRPRVWVLATVYDPELPIRGRYLGETLLIPAEGFSYVQPANQNSSDRFSNRQWAHLEWSAGKLVAKSEGTGSGGWVYLQQSADGSILSRTETPVLVFIPDNAVLPTLKAGEETWVEVTIPKKGPPRPIRLGTKKNGTITPLQLN